VWESGELEEVKWALANGDGVFHGTAHALVVIFWIADVGTWHVCGALFPLDEKTTSGLYREWYVWECSDLLRGFE
jgi:hypothetical protein